MKCAGLMMCLGLVACGDKGGDSGGPLALDGDADAGADVYAASCGSSDCHGADGAGKNTDAEDLREQVPALSDASLVGIIQDGFGAMPPQTALSNQDIADVLVYLHQQFDN